MGNAAQFDSSSKFKLFNAMVNDILRSLTKFAIPASQFTTAHDNHHPRLEPVHCCFQIILRHPSTLPRIQNRHISQARLSTRHERPRPIGHRLRNLRQTHRPSPRLAIPVKSTSRVIAKGMTGPNALVRSVATVTRLAHILEQVLLEERVFLRRKTLHRAHRVLLLEALVDIAVQVGKGVGDLVMLGHEVHDGPHYRWVLEAAAVLFMLREDDVADVVVVVESHWAVLGW
jgi:hypothetical protein